MLSTLSQIKSFLPQVAPGQAVTARRKVADVQPKEREVHFDSRFEEYGPSWPGDHDSYGVLVCDGKNLRSITCSTEPGAELGPEAKKATASKAFSK